MEPVDVSIHGWPLGPVPIIASIYSALIYFSILIGRKKLNSNNTISPFGVAALIVISGAALFGIRDRGDLSESVILAAGAAGIVVSIVLSAQIHRKAGVPMLHKWILFRSLSTQKILAGSLGMIVLFLVFYGLDAMFPDSLSDPKCNTGKCINSAIAFGSNLFAAGLLWLTTWLLSVLGMVSLLHAKELFLRILSSIWGRTKRK